VDAIAAMYLNVAPGRTLFSWIWAQFGPGDKNCKAGKKSA